MRITGECETGFSWISSGPAWLERAAHALVANGEVWIVDPVDFAGLDARLLALGEPRAVLQLFEGHGRDCAAIAARLGVPMSKNPVELPGSPFQFVRVPGPPGWRETALWWPGTRTLVVAEAVGTARHYRAPGRALGVHPLLRIVRPPRVLEQITPEHLLVGHGHGLHQDVPVQLRLAVRRARRDLPWILPGLFSARLRPDGKAEGSARR